MLTVPICWNTFVLLLRTHCVFYRHMIDRRALTDHLRTKVHKRKVKDLQEEPYSHKEAEQSGGVGVYVPRTATVERDVLDAAGR